jgi:hypothetical protein
MSYIGDVAIANTFQGQDVGQVVRIGSSDGLQLVVFPQPTALAETATATLTAPNILANSIIKGTPAADATYTLPTAALIVAGQPDLQVNDSWTFSVIDTNGTYTITLAVGTGGTLVGSGALAVSTSAMFRITITNITSGSEAYDLYRIA